MSPAMTASAGKALGTYHSCLAIAGLLQSASQDKPVDCSHNINLDLCAFNAKLQVELTKLATP